MNSSKQTLMLAGAVLMAGALATGCVVAPAPVVAGPDIYAPVAPPPPYAEVAPPLPYAGAIWIGGYWNWSGHRHVWVPGRYERPRPGMHWEPRRWEPRPGGGWVPHGGRWSR